MAEAQTPRCPTCGTATQVDANGKYLSGPRKLSINRNGSRRLQCKRQACKDNEKAGVFFFPPQQRAPLPAPRLEQASPPDSAPEPPTVRPAAPGLPAAQPAAPVPPAAQSGVVPHTSFPPFGLLTGPSHHTVGWCQGLASPLAPRKNYIREKGITSENALVPRRTAARRRRAAR